ncbi:MAG: aldo/keto reductase [Candidatus Omnitrophica bacterium]|nr:aldo/keto reductase [Candidatus Omnitrophota bacterium]
MNKICSEKMSLGTAQFGLNYGIANKNGRMKEEDVYEVLRYAGEAGIRHLDTAYAYGDSEKMIGDFLSGHKARFNVVSKMPDIDGGSFSSVDKYFAETLRRLGTGRIYGYLAHRVDNVLSKEGFWPALESIKEKGLAEKIGVSIYTPMELELILERKINFDIIQIPYNVFDRRFEEYFPMLHGRGIEIHVRSVFLQGLFFLDAERISREFGTARHNIEEMRHIAEEHDFSVKTLCLCFALLNPLIDKVIIGVDSPAQLKENVDSVRQIDEVKKIYDRLGSLQLHDENVILPYKWQ